MNTTEKLNKIKSECERLIELAKRRTPGFWSVDYHTPYGSQDRIYSVEGPPSNSQNDWPDFERKDDAVFVCECAGAAEAGWRSTIAAIDHLLRGWEDWASGEDLLSDEIITAWEGLV